MQKVWLCCVCCFWMVCVLHWTMPLPHVVQSTWETCAAARLSWDRFQRCVLSFWIDCVQRIHLRLPTVGLSREVTHNVWFSAISSYYLDRQTSVVVVVEVILLDYFYFLDHHQTSRQYVLTRIAYSQSFLFIPGSVPFRTSAFAFGRGGFMHCWATSSVCLFPFPVNPL